MNMANARERVSPMPGGTSIAAMIPIPTPKRRPKSSIMIRDERRNKLNMDNLPEKLLGNITQERGDFKGSSSRQTRLFLCVIMSDKNYYVT
jgi:hypothetical protein